MTASGEVSINELLNYATKIGVQAKLDDLSKSQLESLLASLNMIEDPKMSLLLTSTYAHRQAVRLKKHGIKTAKFVNEAMNWLYNKGGNKAHARMLLRFAIWVFECVEHKNLPMLDMNRLTLEDLLKVLRGV